ncbi:MAG: serine hydrolase [Verrucomicrobiota bacterium]
MSPTRRTFFKHLSLGGLSLWLSPTFGETLAATVEKLPRNAPANKGVSSEAILHFLEAVEKQGFELHSFMMLRHGEVIAEAWWDPYGPDFIHTMYSMSKSFTSTAVGLAVAEGKLSVEDKVVSFFPDDLPATVSENLAALRVKDLLTMSVGNEKEPTQTVVKSENWVRTFLAQPISHKPGTVFMYNSAATYMCSAIVQKVTGQKILDYLTPRLFVPLGIAGMTWESCPKGINTGGWGLSVQTEALAKFGQLYLQKGEWKGQRILPAAWVAEATAFHIQQPGDDRPDRPKANNDWLQGYGYQFWRCQHGHFRGDGAFGQFTIVLPEQEAVIVMTSENKNMQGQLDLVWEHLLPAMSGASPATDAALVTKAKSLNLPPAKGSAESPNMERVSGKVFTLAENPMGLTAATFVFQGNTCVFTARSAKGPHVIACGIERWQKGITAFPETPPRLISGGKPPTQVTSKVAASATWTDENTLVMTWRYYETPHHDTVTCRFEGDKLSLTFLNSITAMNPKATDVRAVLTGQLGAE